MVAGVCSDYILKGPEPKVVIAEALGYGLARSLGIAVPECALCRHPRSGQVYFASREAPLRSIEALLGSPAVENPAIITDCFALDVWIANLDRNVGNYVGEPRNRGHQVRVLAIDFEKSHVLAGVDRFTVTGIPDRSLQPREGLKRMCFDGHFPDEMCGRIEAMSSSYIEQVFGDVASALAPDGIPWQDSAVSFLSARARTLRHLADTVWHA